MEIVEYVVRVRHDRGRATITTWAKDADTARELVRRSERCPDSAIISARPRFPRYGDKRDYPPIELWRPGEYVATTTWARTCKEAVARYAEAHPGAAPVRANFKH